MRGAVSGGITLCPRPSDPRRKGPAGARPRPDLEGLEGYGRLGPPLRDDEPSGPRPWRNFVIRRDWRAWMAWPTSLPYPYKYPLFCTPGPPGHQTARPSGGFRRPAPLPRIRSALPVSLSFFLDKKRKSLPSLPSLPNRAASVTWLRGQASIAFQQPSNPGLRDVGPVRDRRIGRGRRPPGGRPSPGTWDPITKNAGRTARRRPPRADLVGPARAGVRFVRVVRSAPRGSDWKGRGLPASARDYPPPRDPRAGPGARVVRVVRVVRSAF